MISMTPNITAILRKYGFWLFTLVGAVILVFLENDMEEPYFSLLAFIFWCIVIFWFAKWVFGQIKSTLKLKKSKTNLELQHLQSQVNPHFFFNTLNNLYGLMDKDVEKAKGMVLRLSDMMRYSIYDGQQPMVSLEKELDFIQNYILLQQSRYHKTSGIELNQHIQEEGIQVMPLLFIILVENAFKHGLENLRSGAYIRIQLIATKSQISFAVENNFDAKELPKEQGIGLKNLKRRLELGYANRHSLSYKVEDDVFKAQLTIG